MPKTSLWTIFLTWGAIGVQSFGGGSSTFILIHQACIRHGWIDEEGFVRIWALAQVSPGINLVKLTVLVAYRLRGWPGVLTGVSGLVLPSAALTMLMTAGFAAIRSQPWVQAALRGILPATIGLSLAMAFQMAQPLLARGWREGRLRLAASVLVLAASTLLLGLWNLSPVLVLVIAGVATMLLMMMVPAKSSPPEMKELP